jgi:hypothetical protein
MGIADAGLLIEARDVVSAARQGGQSALDAVVLDDLVGRYLAAAAAGLAANLYRSTATAKDARRIAPPVPHLRGPDPAVRHPP